MFIETASSASGGSRPHRDRERQVEQVHLQADFVGHPHQRRVRERAEVEVGQQWTRIVGQPVLGPIDRGELPCGSVGFTDHVECGDALGRRVGLVDDDGPRAVRMPIHRRPGRAVDGSHLRMRVGRHRGGVERRILDGVTHPEDELVAHRLHVEQRTAMVQVEFAVPTVVQRVTEVHELWRRTDIELQALEDGGHVIAFVVQRLLHALGVDRACTRPFFYGDLQHFLVAELLDAPGHAGAVDHVPDQQQFGNQDRKLRTGQPRVSGFTHRPKINSTML